MVYIRIQITNGRNIARSFSPLIHLCASKKRGSYISSINVNETEEWKRTWRQIRVNIVRNVKHFLFFSTRLLTELLAKASPSTRIFSVTLPFRPSIRDPPIRYRRSVFSNTRYIPSPPPFRPESTGEQEGTRGYAVALTHVYTYDFSIGPRDIFPSLRLPSLPSTSSSAAILFPIGRDAIPDFN